MENFLMNVLGIAAIAGMLYGLWIMWRNVDRELEKIEKVEKRKMQKTKTGNYKLRSSSPRGAKGLAVKAV